MSKLDKLVRFVMRNRIGDEMRLSRHSAAAAVVTAEDDYVKAAIEAQRAEVRANYEHFETLLPYLLAKHPGKFAALRHRKIVDVFDSFSDALEFCAREFSDQRFSVQQIVIEHLTFGSTTHVSTPGALQHNQGAAD